MNVVCFGDSTTWGYDPRGFWGGHYDTCWVDVAGKETGYTFINEGSNGRTIPISMSQQHGNADILIIMLGTNDLLQGATAEETGHRMEIFLNSLLPCQILLLSPPLLQRGAWVAQDALIQESRSLGYVYRQLAGRLGILFADTAQWGIPLAYDGVHFTEEGHRIFGRKLADLLKKPNTN